MKIMWICNFVPSFIAQQEDLPVTCMGGWVESLVKAVGSSDISVAIACFCGSTSVLQKGTAEGIAYYLIPEDDEKNLKAALRHAINEIEPDIMHVWGTEYRNALHAVKVFDNPDKTIVHIQGVCSAIALHYCNGIPYNVQIRCTLKDMLRGSNILQSKLKMKKAGDYEKEILQNVSHVIGRTEFDRACTKLMNSNIQYHYCGEALRREFLESATWNARDCEKHTVFVSQASYPVKGLHIALRGFAILKGLYPDLKVYIAGNKIEQSPILRERLRQTYYDRYILRIIMKLGLLDTIEFIGLQSGLVIAEHLRKANAYLLCSVIENSPNSLQEAMCVGTPAVVADVGGVKSFVQHEDTGLLYQCDAYYMMAYHLQRIFDDDIFAEKMAEREHNASIRFSDISAIKERMDEIYRSIYAQ